MKKKKIYSNEEQGQAGLGLIFGIVVAYWVSAPWKKLTVDMEVLEEWGSSLHFRPGLQSLRSHSQIGAQVFIIAKGVTTRNALQIDRYSQTTSNDQ